jgi:ribosome assembly protein 1
MRVGLGTSNHNPEAPVLVYISKIVSHESKVYMTGDADATIHRTFMGFARVFSGTLTGKSKVFVLNPKYNPLEVETSALQRSDLISDLKLYLMMGQDMECVDSIPAGNICAIEGVSEHVLKSATLCR